MTTAGQANVVDGLRFPEGNRWHQGELWFVDMHAGEVFRCTGVAGTAQQVMALDGDHASGIGWLPDGDLVVSSMARRLLVRVAAGGRQSLYADLSVLTPWQINDVTVDRRSGRVYVGCFGYDALGGADLAPGQLFCVETDGSVREVADGLLFPNKAHLLPGTRTLVVAETWGERLTAFDLADSGELGGRRTWAQISGLNPDGGTVDAEGAIWVANLLREEFVRVTDGGQVSERIPVPGRLAVDCALGGPSGTTLFLSTANSWDPAETERRIGRIEAVEVAVPGPAS